jgi:sec-independent protein translocase protein TatC
MAKRADIEEEALAEGTLVSHLVELRQRLVRAVLAILVIFLCLLPFRGLIWGIVSGPLVDALPEEATMIATGPITPFFTPFMAVMYAAVFLAMPVVLYQIWGFVAPGLYRRERRFAVPLLVSSIVLFYTGVAFAYFVVFGIVFSFMANLTNEYFEWLPEIKDYLSFVLRMCFVFGIAFEVPIATFMLIWSRLVPIETLARARAYVFLGAFVVGMFLTPPDAISQTLLAVPMYLLYESGLIMARIMLRDQIREAAAAKADGDAADND